MITCLNSWYLRPNSFKLSHYWFLPVLLDLEMHNTNVSVEMGRLSKLFVTTITRKVSPLLQGFVTKNVSFILLPGPEMNIKQEWVQSLDQSTKIALTLTDDRTLHTWAQSMASLPYRGVPYWHETSASVVFESTGYTPCICTVPLYQSAWLSCAVES